MDRWLKKGVLCLMMAVLCALLAGCSSFKLVVATDELYTLPQLPPEYTELNQCIRELLDAGAEYAAPVSGTNIQTVQLVDLDGDGQQEALAFLRKSSEEKPLKIYIFSPNGKGYELRTVIEGSGSAIYSVAYQDLNDDGKQEILVGWKVGAELQTLAVYTLRGGGAEELARTNYVKYAVLSLRDSAEQELVVLRADDEGAGIADYYTWTMDGTPGGGLTSASAARLSMTMAELNSGRVTSGYLRDGSPALFVTGKTETGMETTDILMDKNGELANIALSDTTGVSSVNYRYLTLFPKDINGDGITEVPAPVSLLSQNPEETETCYRIDWFSYDQNGDAAAVCSTYHDIEDGWYLDLPASWLGKIAITRAPSGMDEMTVTFSTRGALGREPTDILKICTITGENRALKATRGNRFILSRQAETIYTAEFLDGNENWDGKMTEDELRAGFRLITTEWLSGDN